MKANSRGHVPPIILITSYNVITSCATNESDAELYYDMTEMEDLPFTVA